MTAVFALLGSLSMLEVVVIAAFALMVFGKRLPEVAMQAASHVMRLRRAVSKMWREAGLEDELRRVRRDVEDAVPKLPKFKAPHQAVKDASRKYLQDLGKDIDEAGETDVEEPREVTPETVESPKNNPALEAARRGADPEPDVPVSGSSSAAPEPEYAPRPVSEEIVSPDDRREDAGEEPAKEAE